MLGMPSAARAAVLFFVLGGVAVPGPARATQTERLPQLEARLADEEGAAQTWWTAWLAGYSAVVVLQGAGALLADELLPEGTERERWQLRGRFLVGGSAALVGVIAGLARPWSPKQGVAPLAGLEGEPRLRAAEALLREGAEHEAFGRSWLTHVGGVAINGAAGLVLWLVYDLPVDGAIQFVVGTGVAQAQIWTQPTGLIGDDPEPGPGVRVSPLPGGAALALTF